MAGLKLYRDIYFVDENETYNLVNPFGLSANTYIRNATAVTETPFVINESTGVFYVELNPLLYSYSNTYDLLWNIQYTSSAPIKNLLTRFRMNPLTLGGEGIQIEVVSTTIIH